MNVHWQLALQQKTIGLTSCCSLQPLSFELDGQQYTVALTQWGEAQATASQASLRAAAMLDLSPINSYLFAADGKLLHANNKAAGMIKNAGEHARFSEWRCSRSGRQCSLSVKSI